MYSILSSGSVIYDVCDVGALELLGPPGDPARDHCLRRPMLRLLMVTYQRDIERVVKLDAEPVVAWTWDRILALGSGGGPPQ